MEEILMMSQLMIQLSNTMKSGQVDDCKTGCLLDFSYFEKKHKLVVADLSKQNALDADSRAIQ